MVNQIKQINKAFTLIEIMIVVVVLGLLIVSALWAWSKSVGRGDDATRKSDIHSIKVAIEEYEKDHDCYPLQATVSCLLPASAPGTGLRPYLDKIPCDPKTNKSYFYDYESSSCPKWFRLYADLEDANDRSVIDGIGFLGNYNYWDGSPNAPIPSGGSHIISGDWWACFSGTCQKLTSDNYKEPYFIGESDCSRTCSQ